MKLKLLFPCDYFDKSAVDSAYSEEFAIAKSIGFECVLFDYDEFLETKKINVQENPGNIGVAEHFHRYCLIIYRGWMLKVEDYSELEKILRGKGYLLITPTLLYEGMHHFDEAYYMLKNKVDTPKTITIKLSEEPKWKWFNSNVGWIPLDIKEHFTDYFIMKDNVKSVKGTDFPDKISVDISEKEFDGLVNKFKELRDDLYTGEIILKQYVPLKKYADFTNEWRAFYFLEGVLTVSKNSNQPDTAPHVPDELINNDTLTNMTSMFYTVDFAETEDGRWIVIETGDGQVSGLCPNQNILEFYTKIQNYWKEKYETSI